MFRLEELQRLEGVKGIAYLCFIASLVGPAFIAVFLYERELLEKSFAVGVSLALAIGLCVTALYCAVFHLEASIESILAGKDKAARALGVGSGYALFAQIVALWLTALVAPNYNNIRTFMVLVVISFVAPLYFVNRNTKKRWPKAEEVLRQREALATSLAASMAETKAETRSLEHEVRQLRDKVMASEFADYTPEMRTEFVAKLLDAHTKLTNLRHKATTLQDMLG